MDRRKQLLRVSLTGKMEEVALAGDKKEEIWRLLEEFHDIWGERGATDLVELHIKTGNAEPSRQRVRRVPYAVRKEMARNLKDMQESNIIQPSNTPWASPVVLICMKDRTRGL